MKTIKTIAILVFIGVGSVGFTSNERANENGDLELSIELNSKEYEVGNWGPWTLTDCLKGLDFRVRNDGYNKYAKKTRWSVEFRNRYEENIHFSTKMVALKDKEEIKKTKKTTSRLHVGPNNGTSGSYFLVNDDHNVYVYINRIRISPKDYNSDYIDCDL